MHAPFISPEGQAFYAVDDLEPTNKYEVGKVLDGDGRAFFVKALLNPDDEFVKEELENEVRWSQAVGPQVAKEFWHVPQLEAHAPEFEWAAYEHIAGSPPAEETIATWMPSAITAIGVRLYGMPLGREGGSVGEWCQHRLRQFGNVAASEFFDDADRRALANIEASNELAAKPKAGIVHGDLSPKNLLVALSDQHIYLTDAEFGTLPERPDWKKPVLHKDLDKPRLHDMAYYYHLLRCQYHRPDLADSFLHYLWLGIREMRTVTETDFMAEFHLSVLERTISMMNHFVIKRNPNKKIDDERRTVPGPYVETIHVALNTLTKT